MMVQEGFGLPLSSPAQSRDDEDYTFPCMNVVTSTTFLIVPTLRLGLARRCPHIVT